MVLCAEVLSDLSDLAHQSSPILISARLMVDQSYVSMACRGMFLFSKVTCWIQARKGALDHSLDHGEVVGIQTKATSSQEIWRRRVGDEIAVSPTWLQVRRQSSPLHPQRKAGKEPRLPHSLHLVKPPGDDTIDLAVNLSTSMSHRRMLPRDESSRTEPPRGLAQH